MLKNTFPLSPTVRHKHEFCKWWIFTLPALSAKLFLWGINTIKALSFQIIVMVVSLAHLTDKEEWLLLHETKSANFPATYWSSSTVWSSPNLIPLWRKGGSKVDQIRWCLNGRPPSTAWISAGGREMGDGRIRIGAISQSFIQVIGQQLLGPKTKTTFYEVSGVLGKNLRASSMLVCIWHVTCDVR